MHGLINSDLLYLIFISVKAIPIHLYVLKKTMGDIVVLLVYVDDIDIIGTDSSLIDQLKHHL